MNESEKAANAANVIGQANIVESATVENLERERVAAEAAAERRSQAPLGPEGEKAIKDLTKKASKKNGGQVPIRLLYDTWDAGEERMPANTVVDMDIEKAKELIRSGKAERADAFPGEE